MLKFVNKFSVYCWLLLIVYFVSHEFNANYGLISFSMAGFLLVKYTLIFTIIYFVSFSLFRSSAKTALFTFFLTLLYLFFGAVHDSIKSLNPGSFISSYTFIFLFIFFAVLLLFRVIKKSIGFTPVFLPFAGFFAMILVCWQSIILGFNFFSNKEGENNLALPVTEELIAENIQSERPDIFYIIFDSYPSSLSLYRDFGYCNSGLDSFLQEKNFFAAHKSISNYPLTPFSLASIFNMNYLDPRLQQKTGTAKFMLQGVETLYQGKLPSFLAKQGYAVKNYSIFNLKDYPTYGESLFNPVKERLIDEQTLWGRFRHDLLWNFTLKEFGAKTVSVTPAYQKQRQSYVSSFITRNIDSLQAVAKEKINLPLFVYCHAMLPHSPYYLNAKGDFWADSLVFKKENTREKFLQQTIFANSIIKQLLNAIMKDRMRPFIIILQGDHGFRDFTDPADRDKIFQNLNAFYFSDNDYRMLYDSISSVNTFRVVLNKYFGQKLKLLPDSAVYIRDPSFDFEKK